MRFILLLTALCAAGCTHVQPWQRGVLAEPAMALTPYPVEQGLDDHTYFSKEATSGGNAVGGGGCGCN
jgi:hypothetical protein